jgi:lipopolysaccharide/colanic/teichoic acid biosynthesis glycosyltransferase
VPLLSRQKKPIGGEVNSGMERSRLTRAVCRVLDLAIAALALCLSAPILIAAGIAVRLESHGPAVFRQRRLGRRRTPFTVYKLRTLRHDADPRVHREYINTLLRGEECESAGLYKLTADDRVTKVGRLLRRSSIDELPQLLNVLRGEMSIVGPRPVIEYECEAYPPSYNRRFAVKPGMTGLWQVSGRSARSYVEMVELDIEWAEQASVGLYLSIVARTPAALLRSSSAA